jgi:glutamate/tyrosine decarboxylase-like PLP-dependent enzyme
VIAGAGATNTGAVDPFAETADVCAAEQLWLHVDGAYGAIGVLHPELASAYEGMNRANSLSRAFLTSTELAGGSRFGLGAALRHHPR